MINFGIQLLVDLLFAGFVDKIGYLVSIILAHHVCGGRYVYLVFLRTFTDAFSGLLISVVFYAVGGGLIVKF